MRIFLRHLPNSISELRIALIGAADPDLEVAVVNPDAILFTLLVGLELIPRCLSWSAFRHLLDPSYESSKRLSRWLLELDVMKCLDSRGVGERGVTDGLPHEVDGRVCVLAAYVSAAALREFHGRHINEDGVANVYDLQILLTEWGECF